VEEVISGRSQRLGECAKKNGSGIINPVPETKSCYESNVESVRMARASGVAGANGSIESSNKIGANGVDCHAIRVDAGAMAVGGGTVRAGAAATGVANLSELWPTLAIKGMARASDANVGGRNCLKAKGRALWQWVQRQSAGAAG
jgi:hypothetical protein